MTNKSTHNGTCQVCGRLQALPGGKLAKHGYEVEFHYFRGVCPGAEHLPLELSRDVADQVAADVAAQGLRAKRTAAGLAAGRVFPKLAKTGRRIKVVNGYDDETIPFADATPEQQGFAVRLAIQHEQSEARECAYVSKQITARANAIHGKQELQPRKAEEERKQIVAGTRIKLHGVERTVLRIEDKTAWGVGPYLNGQCLPHVVFANDDGKEFAYPVRLIRQASIIG